MLFMPGFVLVLVIKPGSVVICQCVTEGFDPLGIELWLNALGASGELEI